MRKLPFEINFNTVDILLELNIANNKIGELKGILKTLKNPNIILNAILLAEAKDSSEIENIITTFDELYKEISTDLSFGQAKEVLNYRGALRVGKELIDKYDLLSANHIKEIHNCVEPNKGSIRNAPGTVIKNTKSNKVIYTPPQSKEEIESYLDNLEIYINSNNQYDSLINMALIHYQFEKIHPFFDGNGRVGRIINILYLVLSKKIEYPILYLSRYVLNNKDEYYQLLNDAEEDDTKLMEFVSYMLKAIISTSQFTIDFINKVNASFEKTRSMMEEIAPKIYKLEIVELMYYDIYTKNEHFRNVLGISKNTATKYLKELERLGFLTSQAVGKEIIYTNVELYSIINHW